MNVLVSAVRVEPPKGMGQVMMNVSRSAAGVISAVLAVAGMGVTSAVAQDTAPESPSYLFVLSAERGRTFGIGGDAGKDRITIRLAGINDHATQFADRPFRDAYVLSITDLVSRWSRWFDDDPPNAVFTFNTRDDPMPHSIVVELDKPRYRENKRSLTFAAWHLHRKQDPSPDAKKRVRLPKRQPPEKFVRGTLFIDSADDVKVINGCSITAGARCPNVNLSGMWLSGENLSWANLTGANLSSAHLFGVRLTGADLSGANLSGADLVAAHLDQVWMRGANLSEAILSGSWMSHSSLAGADLTGANLAFAHLDGADLSGANLTGARLVYLDLENADLSGATWNDGHKCGVDLNRTGRCL